ncbi:MAG: GNAT family N-acetyltransferase [Acidobacteriota bacterium]|nr:GNAT family N-acetyltransferase [Acidobacteriota bacterium]
MPTPHPLDNPIWAALTTEHSMLALGGTLAKRYPAEIGPLSAMADQSAASYEALRVLAGPGGVLVLFLAEPPLPPPGWTLVRGGQLSQMICLHPECVLHVPDPTGFELRCLTAADIPAMLELTELTEPGPFRQRTIELGAFWGIFDSGRLLAMTGQRLHLPGFVEVSAVCTHPDARGRGYARVLMSRVLADIRRSGEAPFLHVLPENGAAIRVYERLGFTLRTMFHLAVLKNEG